MTAHERKIKIPKNKKINLKQDVDIYRRIFDSFQNGIIVTDANGYVTHFNKPYGQFLGLDHRKQIGKHCTEVVENTRMHIVGKTGKAEINHIQEINGLSIVVQRIPVKKNNKVIAVFGLVMFSSVKEITDLAKKVGFLESKVKLYEAELLNLRSTRYSFESIISESPVMEKLKHEALRATANSFSVLILGDCGTGKELFAQAIHHSSARQAHPFVKINCAAIPKDLLESELFGYEKGAFTGAQARGKPGKFELAHRGTIFLDEIGDMPIEMQPKLLRVIEEKEFERVGGSKVIRSDFRLIAATNQNLEKKMDQGGFRKDLFYRLNVIKINIPPLRHRKEDILLLAKTMLNRMATEIGMQDIKIDKKAQKALLEYSWPGNVRELVNVLERTLSNLDNEVILLEDLPFGLHQKNNFDEDFPSESLRSLKMDTEKIAVENALKACNFNKTKAAEKLGIHRTLLYRKIKKHKLPLNK